METSDNHAKQKNGRKRWPWMIAAGALLALLVFGGVRVYRILYAPQDLFHLSQTGGAPQTAHGEEPTPETAAANGSGTATEPAAASAPPSPLRTRRPGITEANDILNILLIGIDRNPTGGKSAGTDPHADVMMVVAINFKKKTVDLISLPRDTFVHAPGVMNGVYKLNASFNVGGGYAAKNGEGFQKVCEAAEYMLGGIPVDYYYGVDFEALVDLVNAIGGVDFDVESPEYVRDGKAGLRHMSGGDVLYYMRIRKVGPEKGDNNRVNRQKKMMIAIFNQLKKSDKLTAMPGLIFAARDSIHTNATFEQTLALAGFAASIDPGAVGMHSMGGELLNRAGWGYCFTDQKARIELIGQIYGMDVPEQTHCSPEYANWLCDYGFHAIRFLKTAGRVLQAAEARKAELTGEQQTEYDALKASYEEVKLCYDAASLTIAGSDTRKLTAATKQLKAHAVNLARLLDYKEKLVWTYNADYWDDPCINEVRVDFR